MKQFRFAFSCKSPEILRLHDGLQTNSSPWEWDCAGREESCALPGLAYVSRKA